MRVWFDTEFQDDGSTIDLISLGAVREDGEEFYREADWVDLSLSNPWVVENVHPHLQGGAAVVSRWEMKTQFGLFAEGATEFWADSPAYDWVVVSQLYGPMIERPKGWPFNAYDLRQYSAQVGLPTELWPPQVSAEHHALADAQYHRQLHGYISVMDAADGWERTRG